MKLKLRDLIAADQQLGGLPNLLPEERRGRLSPQVAYWAAKNAQRMKADLIAFEAANRALFEKYAQQVSQEKPERREIPPDKQMLASAEFDELVDQEVEIEPYLIRLELLEKDGITLGIHDMLRIEFMIAEP